MCSIDLSQVTLKTKGLISIDGTFLRDTLYNCPLAVGGLHDVEALGAIGLELFKYKITRFD